MYDFDKCLAIANESGGDNHLLLGNGFSIDLFPDIFNYKSLAEQVTSERLKRLLQNIETNDFEYVMHMLTNAIKIAAVYENGNNLISQR